MTDSADSRAIQALLLEAVDCHKKGLLAEAQALYAKILARAPRHFDALHLSGVCAAQSGRPAEAVSQIDRALAVDPANAGAHYNRGIALMALNRPHDAVESYDRAIRLQPSYGEAHNNRGNALRDLKQFDAALRAYDEAIRLNPAYAEAYNNRGNVFKALKKPEAAIESYARAIALRPDYAETHNNLGTMLQVMGRHEEALRAFDHAVRVKPDYADASNNRGVTLDALKRREEALRAFDQALRLKPDLAAAYYNRAACLEKLQRHADALGDYDTAFRLNPDLDGLRGERVQAKMRYGAWPGLEKDIADLIDSIRAGKLSAQALHPHAISDDPDLLRRASRIHTDSKFPAQETELIPRRNRSGKIRIGYFSPDFYDHALSVLMVGLFEAHDRTQFETFAFSYGATIADPMRERLRGAFDHFVDVASKNHADVVAIARSQGIEIAVDLAGHTAGARTGIFAKRAAPVQVSYMGYPGTMAAPYIDYIVGDGTVIPAAGFAFYDEKVALLPESFQPNDRLRPVPDKTFGRAELGLPPAGFVFCSFNSSHKITPQVFESWMRILRAVEGSTLWLLGDAPLLVENLRREAAVRGVTGDRIVFAKRMAAADHLARQSAADLFLDTYPYNAGTTASDALWMGLPILTRPGASYVSRMGVSLLKAVDLPELITATPSEYEALAVALASEPARLAGIKAKLARNRMTTSLFDTVRTTRHLEDAYVQMVMRYDADLAPVHITVLPRPATRRV